ncbi:hypothetical protein HZA97_06025 [Candidatus Woesearchaeota archaeon]|nr:hypothetical protein [Candidatus Woesearchaeota archaeon]
MKPTLRAFLRSKKAQLIGQVLMFILAVIVFTLVISFGYKFINQVLEKQKTVALIDFSNTLKEGVERIKFMQGSTTKLELKVPSGYEKVCFADNENAANNKMFPLLAQLASYKDQNVFLQPIQDFKIKIEGLRVKKGGSICCLPAQNNLVLKLESAKEGVYVSPWEDYITCNQ